MPGHTAVDETSLSQLYRHSGIPAIDEAPEAEGVTILRTTKGQEYCLLFSFQENFTQNIIHLLTAADDRQILYIIHVWKNHALDVPSYDLREALLSLHPENRNARMLLVGEKNFHIRSIEETMPKKKEGQ